MLLRTCWSILALGLALLPGTLHAAAPDSRPYAAVLAASVDGGKVDYAKVRQKRAQLEAYLNAVATQDPKALGADAKAFYINAYNALVLRAVLDEQDRSGGKLKSVLDVKGFFDARTHRVAGEDLTLNALEEKKLRKAYNDPRIHFAVNCASASCPPLINRPYTTASLDKDLEALTRAYLASPHGLKLVGKGVTGSKIFEWYAGDFGGADGVKTFLKKYAPASAQAALASGSVGFHEYDWALNAR